MIRKVAVELAVNIIREQPIISANGFLSRDLYEILDKPSNFYMIGSMGLASSIGLGIALKYPKKVFVFDGDGSILMNLGSLTTIGSIRPRNLVHLVFDNSSHESTGGQPTSTKLIQIDEIAKAVNYKVFKANSKKGLKAILEKSMSMKGPIMILIKISKSDYVSKRVEIEPPLIKSRFTKALSIK